MPADRLRIVLVAEESAGVQTLRSLAKGQHEIFMVLTSANEGTAATASVAGLAKRLGYTVEPAARLKDPEFAQTLSAGGVDLLLNVNSLCVADGAVVDAPKIGSFNLHPGPLPQYAGLNCPSWAICNGEREHGVTVHWMASGIDTGSVAYMAKFPLSTSDTGLTVSARCVSDGRPLIDRLLDDALAGTIPKLTQNLRLRRVYLRRDIPYKGLIDWTLPVQKIDAFVRAADFHPLPSPWGHPLAEVDGRYIGVIKIQRTGRPCCGAPPGTIRCLERDVAVATADDWLTLRLIAVDGRPVDPVTILMDGMRFASLARSRLGTGVAGG